MAKHLFRLILVTATVVTVVANSNAQSNLLQNPNADRQSDSWRAYGEATIEACGLDNPCFVVRNGGYFSQDVVLPAGAAGQYALFIGSGASERVNPGGAITGLPYLYGYMMAGTNGRILDYLQGQNMLLSPTRETEWVAMSGIFRVPEGTNAIRFFLNQALRNGITHNSSAARFDDVGLYLFATEQDARIFAKARR
jgi:hypothetical protein